MVLPADVVAGAVRLVGLKRPVGEPLVRAVDGITLSIPAGDLADRFDRLRRADQLDDAAARLLAERYV